jgi:hypothetical protein
MTIYIVNEEEKIPIEIDENYLEFYRKETGKKHITKKGLLKFIKKLIVQIGKQDINIII